jgi:hypothetical protein
MSSEWRKVIYQRKPRNKHLSAREGYETPVKDGKTERERIPSSCLAHGLGKLKPNMENPSGNALRRLSLDLGCNATAAAA